MLATTRDKAWPRGATARPLPPRNSPVDWSRSPTVSTAPTSVPSAMHSPAAGIDPAVWSARAVNDALNADMLAPRNDLV